MDGGCIRGLLDIRDVKISKSTAKLNKFVGVGLTDAFEATLFKSLNGGSQVGTRALADGAFTIGERSADACVLFSAVRNGLILAASSWLPVSAITKLLELVESVLLVKLDVALVVRCVIGASLFLENAIAN